MKEADIQRDIKKILLYDLRVAWVKINTTGTFKGLMGGRPIRIGIVGESDIIGQLKDGRFFAIEVKLPGEKPTEIQLEFLAKVADNNGVSGWATSVKEAIEILDKA